MYIMLGLAAGVISGLIGIGGGIIVVPALIYIFHMGQHQAQGTTLALLVPPIGLLAAWTYYRHGYVNIPAALFICTGFILGSFYGAKTAISFPDIILQKVFGISLLFISLYMIFGK